MKRINEGECHWRETMWATDWKNTKDRGPTCLKIAQHPKGAIRIRFEDMMTKVQ